MYQNFSSTQQTNTPAAGVVEAVCISDITQQYVDMSTLNPCSILTSEWQCCLFELKVVSDQL
jgi:hypothetical protein